MAATEDGGGPIIDTVARELLDSIVQGELAELAEQPPEAQEAALPTLLSRVEQRAVAEAGALAESGGQSYQFGDLSKSVVESVRGEVQRQVEADWSTDDISLLLKVCLFLGAGTAAPVAGLAAMPAAVLLATYGTVLKAELGVRAVQEVGVRLAAFLRAAAALLHGPEGAAVAAGRRRACRRLELQGRRGQVDRRREPGVRARGAGRARGAADIVGARRAQAQRADHPWAVYRARGAGDHADAERAL